MDFEDLLPSPKKGAASPRRRATSVWNDYPNGGDPDVQVKVVTLSAKKESLGSEVRECHRVIESIGLIMVTRRFSDY